MGLPIFHISSHFKDTPLGEVVRGLPNPNPMRFYLEKIEHSKSGKYTTVLVKYPDCKNYEGRKILVFENIRIIDLMSTKFLDPHFTDEKTKENLVPIARFVPSEKGLEMARLFMEAMENVRK